jgi:hypothetical protein
VYTLDSEELKYKNRYCNVKIILVVLNAKAFIAADVLIKLHGSLNNKLACVASVRAVYFSFIKLQTDLLSLR